MGDDALGGGQGGSEAGNFGKGIRGWSAAKKKRNLAQARGIFAGGVVMQQWTPGLVGQLHGLIAREISKERRGGAKETPGAIGDADGDVGGLGLVGGLVDEQMHFPRQTGLVDRFHDTIGIESGGQIRRGDDQNVVRQAEEMHDLGGDAGAGIEEEKVVILGDMAEIAGDGRQPGGIEIGEPVNPGGAANEPNTVWPRHDGILEGGAALQNVEEGLTRGDTGKNMGVRHAEIGVEEKDAPSEPGESDREVDASGGFADASLAAGHGHHAGGAHGGGESLANDRDGVAFDEEPAMDLPEPQIAVATVEKGSEVLLDELELAGLDARGGIEAGLWRTEAGIHGEKNDLAEAARKGRLEAKLGGIPRYLVESFTLDTH
jgi:hypothetical protein